MPPLFIPFNTANIVQKYDKQDKWKAALLLMLCAGVTCLRFLWMLWIIWGTKVTASSQRLHTSTSEIKVIKTVHVMETSQIGELTKKANKLILWLFSPRMQYLYVCDFW